MPDRPNLAARLREGPPLILDGATGTELEARGVRSELPLWSTHALLEAPDVLAAIHRDYARAGAEALTAASFRTQRRTLERAGLGSRAAELCAQAAELARRAGDEVYVLGSAPPLEDCYRPDRVPADQSLRREHGEHAANLAAAGVDAILAETHNSVREARAAVHAAAQAGLPAIVSFVCGAGARLLSGEPLALALDAVAPLEPVAVGVNCLPPSAVEDCLEILAAAGIPFGVYANLGAPGAEPGAARSDACSPDEYAAHAQVWLRAGARFVGGCCGTTPAHVRAVATQRSA
jgi:S-methylmethionine-dependent homocysteine/selenocysteine methylase